MIELGSMELGAMALPALERLEIVTGGLRAENLASIRDGDLPRLTSLLLCIGDPDGDEGCTVTMRDLGWILAGQNLARVKHLGLAGAGFGDAILEALPTSPILGQLETLDLSRGSLTEEGAQRLLDHAHAFSHLSRLDLTDSGLDEDVEAELRTLPGAIVGRVRGGRRDPRGGWLRYVAIGE